MNIILKINGGIGKVVMASAVVSSIRKKYPSDTIVVVSGHPEVLYNNQEINRSLGFHELSYFYEDYIKNKDVKIFSQEPYNTEDYILNRAHVIKSWVELCDLEYNGESPQVFLSKMEKEKYISMRPPSDKPILVLQTNGGVAGYSWVRDMPGVTAMKLINKLKDRYTIIHMRLDGQPKFEGTMPYTTNNRRDLIGLLSVCDKAILIDSCGQHIMAGLGRSATVLWPVNNVTKLGYTLHNNIVGNAGSYDNTIVGAFASPDEDITGSNLINCPFGDDEIFDVDEIIKSI